MVLLAVGFSESTCLKLNLLCTQTLDVFINFVVTMACPKELGEPIVDPGLAEKAKKMRQQELDACAASETGDPLSLNSMKSYRTYLNFYKVCTMVDIFLVLAGLRIN